MSKKKIIIVTAPSGAGKGTLIQHIVTTFPDQVEFSISTTTRQPRGAEVHGKHYYFITVEQMQELIQADDLYEHEEVYLGKIYGTTNAELERIWALGKTPLLDIDVMGAARVKQMHPDAYVIYISVVGNTIEEQCETLRKRLQNRETEDPAAIAERIARAPQEIAMKDSFDAVVVNDELAFAQNEIVNIVYMYLHG